MSHRQKKSAHDIFGAMVVAHVTTVLPMLIVARMPYREDPFTVKSELPRAGVAGAGVKMHREGHGMRRSAV
jgi:hypothetical protein